MTSSDSFFTAPLASSFHRREAGTGFLHASNGGSVGCRFILEQVPEGTIVLRCLLDIEQRKDWMERPSPDDQFFEHNNLSFDLVTENGYRLENLFFHPLSGGVIVNGIRQSFEFDLSKVDLSFTKTRLFNRPVAYAEFSIVNFKVDGGIAGVRFSSAWHWNDKVVVLNLGDRECWLRPVVNGSEIIKKLETDSGIEVTSTFMVPLKSLDEWDDVEQRIDKLCTVLTLLSGNRVSWISARAVDSWGYSAMERFRNSVTWPYSMEDIVNILADKGYYLRVETHSLIPIIERMLVCFDEAQQKWNVTAAVNTWHATINSKHFLEQKGLLIGACVEMLRTQYLKSGGRETIVKDELFNKHKNSIGRELKKSIKEKFPPPADLNDERKKEHDRDLSLMYKHVNNLNRFPFRHSLEQMASELNMFSRPIENGVDKFLSNNVMSAQDDVTLAQDSIACFVRIRDQLTHQGAYFSLTDDGAEPGIEERVRQLRFMQRFAAALMCSILGWIQPFPLALKFDS